MVSSAVWYPLRPVVSLCRAQALLDETKCVSALPKMIVTGYKELNLIYYFSECEKVV